MPALPQRNTPRTPDREGLCMKLLLCRTIILYLCVLFAMRLMGKRQLGELQPEELVSTILISNLASISIESEDVPVTASLIPLFLIALYAFTTEGNEVMTLSFTWGNFAKFLETTYLNVILKSFWLGLLTTFICLVLGYPLALIIARCSEKVQGLLIMLVTIPMWINMLLRTYAWMNLLADNGIINNLLAKIGLGPISMMYTDFSVMVGLICNFMPFMIIPIHTSLNKMDKSLIEAAYDLGANRFQTFWKVIWKLSLPGVVNGIMMVFLLAISSFVIPKLLGGGQYMLIGNLIESQFISVGDWNFGSAISMIMAVIMMVLMMVVRKIEIRNQGGKGV